MPDSYYAPYEFGRLRFTATGQLAEVTADTQKMIVGGLIICRSLCRELFFNTSHYFNHLRASPHGFANLEVLGAIIDHAFVQQVDRLAYVADNTAHVTLNEEPTSLERGIDAKDAAANANSNKDGLLLGVMDNSATPVETQSTAS